jgi:ferrous iron transport protein A
MATLLELTEGKTACIVDLSHLNDSLKQRLLHFGVCEGCPIQVKNRMPFGGPCMVECQGQLIGIRQKDAKMIRIESER